MESTETIGRCPNCGGTVVLDETGLALVCEHCRSAYTYERLKSTAAPQDESLDHHEYVCSSCGAAVVVDEHTLTSRCAYCGNTSIVKDRVSGRYRPDYILPYRVSIDEAKRSFLGVLKGREYVKKGFRDGFEVEGVTSLYVPFWLYDCSAKGSCTYRLPDGRTHSVRFSESYAKVPVDASVRVDDSYMDAIEPFDYADLEPFHSVYLVGRMAERYDTDARTMSRRAQSKVKRAVRTSVSRHVAEDRTSLANATLSGGLHLTQALTNGLVDRAKARFDDGLTRNNVNFSVDREGILNEACSESVKSIKTRVEFTRHQYALFPIYLLRGRYRGRCYLYAINGQSGRVSGRFPYSRVSHVASRLIGEAFGALAFSAAVSIPLRVVLSGLGVSALRAFGAVYALGFLLIHVLESKTSSESDTSDVQRSLGAKSTVPNATQYRVPGSFKVD